MTVRDGSTTPKRPLKIGLFLPYVETMLDGATPRWTDIQAVAQLAEEVGFDSVWFGDHLLFRTPGQNFGGWECWSLLAALAAVTKRITLGPLVSCMGFRNPALLAKMADTVDEISGGRLILGLGAGWNEPEFAAFGFPFDRRAARFAEGVRIIHALLREGKIDFSGEYYQAHECELRPRGPRPSGPPIMIGTTGTRMLRLAARYGDLWNTDRGLPTGLEQQQAALDAACREVGRDPATLARTAMVRVDLPGVTQQPLGLPPARVTGSPEELAVQFRHYAAQGIAHLQIWLAPNNLAGIEAFAPVLHLLDR